MKVTIRKDLLDQGLIIPCVYPEGTYMDANEVENSEFLGRLDDDQSLIVLLCPYQNGTRVPAIVNSIDLDFEGQQRRPR